MSAADGILKNLIVGERRRRLRRVVGRKARLESTSMDLDLLLRGGHVLPGVGRGGHGPGEGVPGGGAEDHAGLLQDVRGLPHFHRAGDSSGFRERAALPLRGWRESNVQRPEAIEMHLLHVPQDGRRDVPRVGVALDVLCYARLAGPGSTTGLKDVRANPPERDDVTQSFFFAETLKYFYLIFADGGRRAPRRVGVPPKARTRCACAPRHPQSAGA